MDRGLRWVEFVDLSPAQLAEAGVDQVRVVENRTGITLRYFMGRPLASAMAPYEKVRGEISVTCFEAGLRIPEEIERVEPSDLSGGMRTVFEAAADLYKGRILAVVFFRDGGVRLGLTFAAECPAGARTILVNLEKVAREVAAGLSVAALRTGLDFLDPGGAP